MSLSEVFRDRFAAKTAPWSSLARVSPIEYATRHRQFRARPKRFRMPLPGAWPYSSQDDEWEYREECLNCKVENGRFRSMPSWHMSVPQIVILGGRVQIIARIELSIDARLPASIPPISQKAVGSLAFG